MITHQTPTSSNISSFDYDPETAILTIHFRSGKNYNYLEVPYQIINEFMSAPSAGKYFASNIRGKFTEQPL